MVTADAAIAWIAVRRPQWLVPALAAFVIEQTVVNGFGLECSLVIVALVAHGVQPRQVRLR